MGGDDRKRVSFVSYILLVPFSMKRFVFFGIWTSV